jgi:hypothetical protein
MGLNRMMMKNGGDLKNIKAMMTVETSFLTFGFKNGAFGSLFPNPLPNGVLVTACYAIVNNFVLEPSSIKSCIINNITVNNGKGSKDLFSYLSQNAGKTIPVIFHFD